MTVQELRRLFNDGHYWQRTFTGHLQERVQRESHVDDQNHTEYCSMSQTVEYIDGDLKVAVVHQYRRSDGTLGASGSPDPKWLLIGDVIFVAGS